VSGDSGYKDDGDHQAVEGVQETHLSVWTPLKQNSSRLSCYVFT
jgi:hypothetical protein